MQMIHAFINKTQNRITQIQEYLINRTNKLNLFKIQFKTNYQKNNKDFHNKNHKKMIIMYNYQKINGPKDKKHKKIARDKVINSQRKIINLRKLGKTMKVNKFVNNKNKP